MTFSLFLLLPTVLWYGFNSDSTTCTERYSFWLCSYFIFNFSRSECHFIQINPSLIFTNIWKFHFSLKYSIQTKLQKSYYYERSKHRKQKMNEDFLVFKWKLFIKSVSKVRNISDLKKIIKIYKTSYFLIKIV